MFNPFMGDPKIDSENALYERKDQIRTLRQYFRNRTNAVIFGPEGSGKSTLLRCFFNQEFCRKKVQENTLIYQGEFPNNLDGEKTYGFFADSVRNSVGLLEVCGMRDQMDAILRSMDSIQFDTKQSRFDQYLNKIQAFGFRMVFVLDNFENFTSSPDVKQEHHDLLCGMLNDDKLQLIVATNYDFNETSLPAGTRNSQLLTRLKPNSIDMKPLSAEACRKMLDQVAEDEDSDFRFTEQQVQELHSVSGGIPRLLRMAAEHAFEMQLEENEDFGEAVLTRTLPDALPFLMRWCKVTPKEQLDLLGNLRENTELQETDKTPAAALYERGLLQKSFVLNREGKPITVDGYTYNSGLFRNFCGHKEWLDEVHAKNPLRKEEPSTPKFSVQEALSGNTGAPIHIDHVTIHHGDRYDHSVNNTLTYQPTVIAEKGFARLFDILDLNRDELGSKLQELFESRNLLQHAVVDADTAAEETAERITAMFIPEEIEKETLEACQEEQKTLEARFNAIRGQIDPEGMVDDALLASLSAKCRLYLQIAFVVDDALSALKDFHLGDLSAQMVMYGKVLEQQLKDNLYQLFRKDAVLKDIDVYTNLAEPSSRDNFRRMQIHKTCIGNYMSILRGQAPRLAMLCSANGICFENQSADTVWWNRLGDDVDAARELRNGGDHAGTETSQNDLTEMRKLLFGDGKILHRCSTGGLLTQTLWPATQPVEACVNSVPMLGQVVSMTNIQVTSRNGIRGVIAGTSYGVAVSPKHLENKNCQPHSLVGKTVQVKLIRWDNNPTAQKYNAELI